MIKIKRVFLDLDGVIAAWAKSACGQLGVDYPTNFQFPDQGWLKSITGAKKIYDITDNVDFWTELERYPWSNTLVDLISNSGKEFRFLTKPMKSPECYYGKSKWIFKNYPKHWNKMWIVTGTKSAICRDSGDLLIDDYEKNIEEWKSAGGTAYHWKEITPDYSTDHVNNRLREIRDLIYT